MTKKIQLLKLKLKNFKGIRSFELDTRGSNVKVFGDNATGKTSLFDAFVWLLFDKDSQNKKDFSIKTLDSDGNVIHKLEHEVEGTFDIDGKQTTLKKVFIEKWTKKRGSAQSEMTGHTTKHFIDDVPLSKKEYESYITSLIDENTFKLLTNPSYFNEQLKWQERRKVLLEIAGDITDEEIILSNEKLSALKDTLNGHSVDDHKKIIASKRKKINDELEKIPVRIDEIHMNLPAVNEDKNKIEEDIRMLNNEIDSKMTQINDIQNGKLITEKQIEVQKIESELLEIKRNHDSNTKDKLYQLKAKIQEEQSNVSILESKSNNIEYQVKRISDDIASIEKELSQLREEWREANDAEFSYNEENTCQTCGQALPIEQVEEARQKSLEQFNIQKSKALEEINTTGKRKAEQKKQFEQEKEKMQKEQRKLNEEITKKKDKILMLETQLKQQESLVTDVLKNSEYVSKLNEKSLLEGEIERLRSESEKAIQSVRIEIVELKERRDRLQSELAKFEQIERAKERIAELEQQEKKLATEFEKLEHELYLTEEFIKAKVNMLEEKINNKFKYARFKLFEQQINGGLNEVCETLYEGVPYGSGLNNAARINVGLDIINTLSDHYGFKAPIFIDNAESVTKLIDVDSQVISLVVSENDKELRVEMSN